MENNNSLWPKFTADKKRLPIDLLIEQANALKYATDGLLDAKVDCSISHEVWGLYDVLKFGANNLTKASFYIIAPALSDYRYRLLFITYSNLELYPISIISDLAEVKKIVYSERELKDVLLSIFQCEGTKQIIETLMVQSLHDTIDL